MKQTVSFYLKYRSCRNRSHFSCWHTHNFIILFILFNRQRHQNENNAKTWGLLSCQRAQKHKRALSQEGAVLPTQQNSTNNNKRKVTRSQKKKKKKVTITKIYKEALANKHTLNWNSEKIRTRRRIEPRASRCPVENFATAPHGITAVSRVI